MKKDEKFVITINRELGSGGRTVGEKLAAKLGVPFYDKALIKALQEKYNLSVEEIERMKGRSHSWWADFKRIVSIGEGMKDVHYYQVMESIKRESSPPEATRRRSSTAMPLLAENKNRMLSVPLLLKFS